MIKEVEKTEVSLDIDTMKLLSFLAEKEGQSLQVYMQDILRNKANGVKLSDDYKIMMDEMLTKHAAGELKTSSWSDAKKRFQRNL